MRRKINILSCILLIILLAVGCSNNSETDSKITTDKTNDNQDKSPLENVSVSKLKGFVQTDTFFDREATINDKGEYSAKGLQSEAWYILNNFPDSNKDFEISATVSVPKYWETVSTKEAQVGTGIFIGKKGDGGKLCFECDLCIIANQVNFVQGQNITNRLTGDPDDVVFKEISDNKGTLTVKYSAKEQCFTLYFNNELVGKSAIDSKGKVNWKLEDDSKFYVGIMGFSENTTISEEFPTVTNFTLTQESK